MDEMVMIFVYRCGPIAYGGRRAADTGRTWKGMLYARTNGTSGRSDRSLEKKGARECRIDFASGLR
jgi:hypothetical protein